MARLFAVPRLFIVPKRARGRARSMEASNERIRASGATITPTKQASSPHYFSDKNQPPLPAA
jgi:hypothetical protein